MDEELYAPLSELESALTSLVDSISTYNPSITSADALIAADASLTQALKRLQTHQSNASTIEALRARSATLSTDISDAIQSLATLRKELLELPLSTPSASTRPVNPTQLLAYATHIARTSVPPSGAARDIAATEEGKDAQEGRGVGALPAEERAEMERLRKEREGKWVPWPEEGAIRSGALARLEAGEEKLDDNKAVGGEDSEEKGSGEERLNPGGAGNTERAAVQEEKPKVFGGLDLYDPDED